MLDGMLCIGMLTTYSTFYCTVYIYSTWTQLKSLKLLEHAKLF